MADHVYCAGSASKVGHRIQFVLGHLAEKVYREVGHLGHLSEPGAVDVLDSAQPSKASAWISFSAQGFAVHSPPDFPVRTSGSVPFPLQMVARAALGAVRAVGSAGIGLSAAERIEASEVGRAAVADTGAAVAAADSGGMKFENAARRLTAGAGTDSERGFVAAIFAVSAAQAVVQAFACAAALAVVAVVSAVQPSAVPVAAAPDAVALSVVAPNVVFPGALAQDAVARVVFDVQQPFAARAASAVLDVAAAAASVFAVQSFAAENAPAVADIAAAAAVSAEFVAGSVAGTEVEMGFDAADSMQTWMD